MQLRSKRRKFLPHYWCFFGGRINKNETPYESLKRKACQELNYEVKNAKYILSTSFEHQDFQSHLHIFAEEYSAKHQISLKDGENWGWFDVSQLDTIKMQEHDRALLFYVNEWIKAQKERDVSIILLHDEHNRILLQKRENNRKFLPGYWSFFGGGLEPGENTYQAMIRETKEELGYKPKNPILIMKTNFQHQFSKANLAIYLDFCDTPETLRLQEGQNWGWFELEAVKKLKMLESDKYILAYMFEYLQKKRQNRTPILTPPRHASKIYTYER